MLNKKGGDKNFEKYISEAIVELDRKGYSKAEKLLKKASSGSPDRYEPYMYLGNLFLEWNNSELAQQNYKKATELNDKFLSDLSSSAELLYQKKVFPRAIIELKKILLIDPENQDAVSMLVRIYTETESFQEAIDLLEGISKKNPDNIDIVKELMYLHEDIGNYDQAFEISESIMKKIENDAFLLNNHGFILQKLGKPEEAMGYVDKAIQIDEHNPLFYNNKGNCLKALKIYDEAIKVYCKSLEFYPDDLNIMDEIASMYIILKDLEKAKDILGKILKINKNDAMVHKNYGEIYYLDGDREKAIEAFENAIAINHKNMESYLRLGQIHYEMANPADAKRYLKTGVNFFPRNKDMIKLLGIIEFEEGNYAEAIKYYKKYIAKNKKDPEILSHLGFIYKELGFYSFAIWAYEKALESSDDEEILDSLVGLNLRMRNLDSSIYYLKKLLNIAPKKIDHYIKLVRILIEKDDMEHAEAVLNVAEKFGKNYSISILKGMLQIKKKDIKQAMEFYKEAIKLDPKKKDAYIEIAKIFLSLNQAESAEKMLTQALKFHGEDAEIFFYLGDTIGKTAERFDEAVSYYEKAKTLDPKISATHYKLAHKYLEMGNLYEARASVQKHLDEFSNDIDALKIQGFILIQLNLFDEALKVYENVLSISPSKDKSIENIIEVLSEELESRKNK